MNEWNYFPLNGIESLCRERARSGVTAAAAQCRTRLLSVRERAGLTDGLPARPRRARTFLLLHGEMLMDQQLREITEVFRIPLALNAKANDKILIITDTAMHPLLWQGLAAAATELNMEPIVTVMTPRQFHACDPASPIVQAAKDPALDLCVYLTSTAMAHAPITAELLDRGKRFLLMEELTPEMLRAGGPAAADYAAMNVLGDKVAALFTAGKRVRVQCDNGTDLSAGIDGRPGRSVAAIIPQMRANGGGGCAFPDGEAHVCPLEGTGEGTIVFDLTAHSVGAITEPLRLTVQNGMVTKIEGGREAAIWRDIFERHGDANSYNCPAEIAIGLNPNVTPTGSMRTDKKLYASAHIGVGDTVVLGGTCHAKLRLEGVIREPLITIDDRVVAKGGKILVD
jgi:2,5-dihydroxypyridine 5,6-dioxygenase